MKNKNYKGSVLAFSLIIFSLMILVALGISQASLSGTMSSLSTGRSAAVFQVADSGIEIVQKAIKDAVIADAGASILSVFSDCATSGSGSALVTEVSVLSGKATVRLYDFDGNASACSDPMYKIRKIKSVGDSGGTSRAVEAAVCYSPFSVNSAVGFWHLEEPAGESMFVDSSSSGQNGTLVEASSGNVKFSYGICNARHFNEDGSTNDYISVSDNGSGSHPLRLDKQQTVEAWVKWDGNRRAADVWKRIVGKGDDVNRNYGLWIYTHTDSSYDKWLFQVYGATNCNALYELKNDSAQLDGRWHYLVGTYDGNGSDKKLKLYVDGVVKAETDCDVNPFSSNDPLTIGHSNNIPTTSGFDGIIDEVRISDSVKSAAEIQNEYLKICTVVGDPSSCDLP